jgi:type III restriction enzyme
LRARIRAIHTLGEHYPIETKGREDIDVAHKEAAALIWCENATALTGTSWHYVKVPQAAFAKLQPADFSNLAVVFEKVAVRLD